MLTRCTNKNSDSYNLYGARGITVCNEWNERGKGFFEFREWAMANGYTEDSTGKELSIDRIDATKGYSPDNCQWISLSANVTRRNEDYWKSVHANQR